MLKIKTKDKVIILCGKEKGKIGIISKIIKKKNGKKNLLIEGVNLVNKHTKAIPNKNKEGGIIKKEAPIDISNVAILNKNTEKKDKIIFKFLKDKKKFRILKSNGEILNWII